MGTEVDIMSDYRKNINSDDAWRVMQFIPSVLAIYLFYYIGGCILSFYFWGDSHYKFFRAMGYLSFFIAISVASIAMVQRFNIIKSSVVFIKRIPIFILLIARFALNVFIRWLLVSIIFIFAFLYESYTGEALPKALSLLVLGTAVCFAIFYFFPYFIKELARFCIAVAVADQENNLLQIRFKGKILHVISTIIFSSAITGIFVSVLFFLVFLSMPESLEEIKFYFTMLSIILLMVHAQVSCFVCLTNRNKDSYANNIAD